MGCGWEAGQGREDSSYQSRIHKPVRFSFCGGQSLLPPACSLLPTPSPPSLAVECGPNALCLSLSLLLLAFFYFESNPLFFSFYVRLHLESLLMVPNIDVKRCFEMALKSNGRHSVRGAGQLEEEAVGTRPLCARIFLH